MIHQVLTFILIGIIPLSLIGQSTANTLADSYSDYKEMTIKNRRFKHDDIVPLIKRLEAPFEVKQLGTSIEGRAIYLVKIGSGKTKVLLWSQMHGNEPSATMAIMDLFNFFSSNDQFDDFKKNILDNVTLYFIPMLNPDGAEQYRRRNALNIDLNRDALRLQNPETQLLKKVRDDLDADWGFNLHDQSRYYSVGTSNKTATMSFLAPAYDYGKSVDPSRKRAMQLIGSMNRVLQQFLPGHVAKYNDTFEPRAFGDNIQKWGTSTILIESGGLKDDPEKQEIRKMNYLALLTAFEAIATKSYSKIPVSEYNDIPFNGRYFHDLIIRNATFKKGSKPYLIDIAFRHDEISYDMDKQFYRESYISDIGDLSTYHGYNNLDASGYTIIPGDLYPRALKNWSQFVRVNPMDLLNKGYTDVQIKDLPNDKKEARIPLRLLPEYGIFDRQFNLNRNPSFFLEKDGKRDYVVINGRLYDLRE